MCVPVGVVCIPRSATSAVAISARGHCTMLVTIAAHRAVYIATFVVVERAMRLREQPRNRADPGTGHVNDVLDKVPCRQTQRSLMEQRFVVFGCMCAQSA